MIPVRTAGTIDTVPNKPRTPHRSVRVDDPEWDDLEAAAEEIGYDRAKVINLLIEDWLGRPGSQAPARPSAEQMRQIVDERHIREREAPKIALTLPCTQCKVPAGSPCIASKERDEDWTFHRARLKDAGKVFDQRRRAERDGQSSSAGLTTASSRPPCPGS